MLVKTTLFRCATAALFAMLVTLSVSDVQAEEPQLVTVVLEFSSSNELDILTDGKVIVFGAGPAPGSTSQKSLDGYFPIFEGENLNKVHALTVTKGSIYTNAVHAIAGLGAPANGSLVLNEDVTIDYIGFVSESSDVYAEDPWGDKLLIILTGPVR